MSHRRSRSSEYGRGIGAATAEISSHSIPLMRIRLKSEEAILHSAMVFPDAWKKRVSKNGESSQNLMSKSCAREESWVMGGDSCSASIPAKAPLTPSIEAAFPP